MTKTRQQWQPYFDHLAGLLHLGHWKIRVHPIEKPCNDDAAADVLCHSPRYGATIRLSDFFLEAEQEEQRYIATHELIHVNYAHGDMIVEGNLAGATADAWSIANEFSVDNLAQAIAPALPLPSDFFIGHGKPGKAKPSPRKTSPRHCRARAKH